MIAAFLTSQAALLGTEWPNAAVLHRLARVELVYGVAALLLATGLARSTRKLVMWEAHLWALIPILAVCLAHGVGTR